MKFVNGSTGDSVINTLTNACNIATHERDRVLLEINDIMIIVEKNSSVSGLLKKYKQKLDFKYEIQELKRARQK